VISERWNAKDSEGNIYGQIKEVFRYLPRMTEDKHEILSNIYSKSLVRMIVVPDLIRRGDIQNGNEKSYRFSPFTEKGGEGEGGEGRCGAKKKP
jgi:hypothetical protein